MPYEKVTSIFAKILQTGTAHSQDIDVKQRITYFNAILIALPTVYFINVLIDIKSFAKPLSNWYLDQWSFFVFVLVCVICIILNNYHHFRFSKIMFLLLWPIILHIAPIIYQHTPTDYYFAFPLGLIFHALLIQIIFSPRRDLVLYVLFLGANLILTLNFITILGYFDDGAGAVLSELTNNPYYLLGVLLYWLLINAIIHYLVWITDHSLLASFNAKNTIEKQKEALEETLEKLHLTNNQLIRSEKLASLGTFTAGISHELNNPINIISSGLTALFSQLDSIQHDLRAMDPSISKKLDDIRIIRNALEIGIDRTTNIVRSFRNYAHPGAETFQMYDVSHSIKDTLVLLSNSYRDRITITYNHPDAMKIVCNPGKINQLFFNLIHNAIEAISVTGEIRIMAHFNYSDQLIIEISDSGCGISEANRSKVFDPFFTTKEVGKGTGLGLYIVYLIVEEHKGTIEIKSEDSTEVNVGTTFLISLPTNLAVPTD